MLMYAITLGEVALFTELIAKSDQLGWWTVSMKFSPSLLTVLGDFADNGPRRFLDKNYVEM